MVVSVDPRIEIDLAGMQEQYDMIKELEGMQQTAADAVKQLAESLKIINN